MKRISAGFAVRCVSGSQILRAVGFAQTVIFPNISMAAASRVGILLKHADFVRAAVIDGVGHRVCAAAVGRVTMIGMKKIKAKVSRSRQREFSIQIHSDFS